MPPGPARGVPSKQHLAADFGALGPSGEDFGALGPSGEVKMVPRVGTGSLGYILTQAVAVIPSGRGVP